MFDVLRFPSGFGLLWQGRNKKVVGLRYRWICHAHFWDTIIIFNNVIKARQTKFTVNRHRLVPPPQRACAAYPPRSIYSDAITSIHKYMEVRLQLDELRDEKDREILELKRRLEQRPARPPARRQTLCCDCDGWKIAAIILFVSGSLHFKWSALK